MEIKLPQMPFKFDSPEGRMEITVRRMPSSPDGQLPGQLFAAVATFIQHGPRALERIPLSARADTYSGVMQALTRGFKVNLGGHPKGSVEFRVLTALCTAAGVVELSA